MREERPIRTTLELVGSGSMLVGHCLAGIVVAGVFAGIVPKYAQLFQELDMELPQIMLRMIHLSVLLTDFWYFLLPMAFLLDAVIFFVLAWLPRWLRWISVAWFGAVLLAGVILLGLTSLAIFISLTQIHSEMLPS